MEAAWLAGVEGSSSSSRQGPRKPSSSGGRSGPRGQSPGPPTPPYTNAPCVMVPVDVTARETAGAHPCVKGRGCVATEPGSGQASPRRHWPGGPGAGSEGPATSTGTPRPPPPTGALRSPRTSQGVGDGWKSFSRVPSVRKSVGRTLTFIYSYPFYFDINFTFALNFQN